MSRTTRLVLVCTLIAVVAVVVAARLMTTAGGAERLTLDKFIDTVAAGGVKTATVHDKDNNAEGRLVDGRRYSVDYGAEFADDVVSQLVNAPNDVRVEVDPQRDDGAAAAILAALPYVIVVVLFAFVVLQLRGGGGRLFGLSRSKRKGVRKDQPKTRFADVAGLDEAVEELQEIKDFLAAPERFRAIGARIPRGVLLYGPPGAGKTLLARAVAGEAGVPFFSISGSDFVEMFVGVGAARVRDLFRSAKSSAPAIIFVDEIDAVGRRRGAGVGGGHDEREQTLNQLLVEMDGFDPRVGVIVIAATNRPDILDPALLRPGRFDRQIPVDPPDLAGRRRILEVHTSGKPLASGVDLDSLARRTPGFTGADLANVVNEAALLAARGGSQLIGPGDLGEAIERVLAGPARKSRLLTEDERRVTAFHEAGHAVVGHALEHAHPVQKVSIVGRGRALGYTLAHPEQDRLIATRAQLTDEVAVCMGGRAAEVVVFGEPSTGAADDIARATRIARTMVCEYGMSDALGPRHFAAPAEDVFLGRDLGTEADHSDHVAATIDAEISRLLQEAHGRAGDILNARRDVLDALALRLVEEESLEGEALLGLLDDRVAGRGSPPAGDATEDPGTAGEPRASGAAEGTPEAETTTRPGAAGGRGGSPAQEPTGEGGSHQRAPA